MKKKLIAILVIVALIALTLTACNAQVGEKGDKGDTGATGNGIVSIEKTSSVDNVDTYTITFTDGTTETYKMTNGKLTDSKGNVSKHGYTCYGFQELNEWKEGTGNTMTLGFLGKTVKIPVTLKKPCTHKYTAEVVKPTCTNAGYTLAQHMIAAGAKRLIYFSNPLPAPTSLKRGTGVGVAVTEAGLKWTKDRVFFADPEDTRAAERLFRSAKRPDAIIAVNDYIAAKLLKTLKAIGKRVPEDVLLAGVNGDPVAEESDPPLTTMAQPCERIGEAAVQLMFQRLADPDLPPRTIMLSAQLKERVSTRRKKK